VAIRKKFRTRTHMRIGFSPLIRCREELVNKKAESRNLVTQSLQSMQCKLIRFVFSPLFGSGIFIQKWLIRLLNSDKRGIASTLFSLMIHDQICMLWMQRWDGTGHALLKDTLTRFCCPFFGLLRKIRTD
jgi:hypothetical protein